MSNSYTEDANNIAKKWKKLRLDLANLDRHKLRLEDDMRELHLARDRLTVDRERFEEIVNCEWFQNEPRAQKNNGRNSRNNRNENISNNFIPPRLIKLNVGGQTFELSAHVLRRDRFSLLAACCGAGGDYKNNQLQQQTSLQTDNQGMLFF